MKRRALIASAGALGLASLAGCLGLVGLDEHEASPAGVDSTAREEAGYERVGVDDLRIEEEAGASVVSETIVVTNYLTEHQRAIDMGPLGEQRGAEFTVLATPTVEIAGRNLNPVEELSAADLAELVAGNYDGINNVEREADEEVTVLEQTTSMATFAADAVFSGMSVDITLHITEAVEAGDDLLVTVAVYPTLVADEEEANVRALLDGVTEDDEGS
jgi:hypothetical protein